MVLRTNAKMCEELGLNKMYTWIYHKNHVEKVMAVAVTGYAFEGNVENGGHEVTIGFWLLAGAGGCPDLETFCTKEPA